MSKDVYKLSGVFHVELSRPVIPRSKPQLFRFPTTQLAGGDIPKPTAVAREPRHQIISASNSSERRYLTEGQLRNTTRIWETDVFVMARQNTPRHFLIRGSLSLKALRSPTVINGSIFMNATCVNHLQRHFRNRENLRIKLQQSKTHIFISGKPPKSCASYFSLLRIPIMH
jgi:hypothetical protein